MMRLEADWPAPENIVAFATTREGGDSKVPYQSFNLALHVGDEPAVVERNRQQLIAACQGLHSIQWLNQVHGSDVVEAGLSAVTPDADACYSRRSGVACAVMTADCVPLLVCDRRGRQVAAIHAGWRGIVAGVVATTIRQFQSAPEELMVWLGPAISQSHFEVDAALGRQLQSVGTYQPVFGSQSLPPCPEGQWYTVNGIEKCKVDLYQVARWQLSCLGVTEVYGGDRCTYRESGLFYSYRRDGVTGRIASLIYRCA